MACVRVPSPHLSKFAWLFRGLAGVGTERFWDFVRLNSDEASDRSVTEHSCTHVDRLEHRVLELRSLRFLPRGDFGPVPRPLLIRVPKL